MTDVPNDPEGPDVPDVPNVANVLVFPGLLELVSRVGLGRPKVPNLVFWKLLCLAVFGKPQIVVETIGGIIIHKVRRMKWRISMV